MTRSEFEAAVRTIMPDAQIETDNYGRLVIYTDLMEDESGQIVLFEDNEN